MIPIRFAYLIAYFVRHDDAETPPTGASKERRERAQKKDRGEVTRKIAAGGRVATASSFMQLAHCCRTDSHVIVSYEP